MRYWRNSLCAGTGNFFYPSREYPGKYQGFEAAQFSLFRASNAASRLIAKLRDEGSIGSATPMRCQCNQIRLAPASWANELTIGQALASIGAPHSACRLASCPRGPDPPVLRGGCSTPDGRKATNRIDALPQRFRLFVGLWRMEAQRLRCNCNSAYGSGALDEGPVPKLAGRPLQLGLRVHHDRRRVPEAVFLRRAETGFLLLLPGPLPRRHCRRERASDCRVRSRIRASLPSISFSGYRRTALMRIRVTCGSHRDVRRSSALPQ